MHKYANFVYEQKLTKTDHIITDTHTTYTNLEYWVKMAAQS